MTNEQREEAKRFSALRVEAQITTDGTGPELRILARLAREYATAQGLSVEQFMSACRMSN